VLPTLFVGSMWMTQALFTCE
jgi:hypothetical protein